MTQPHPSKQTPTLPVSVHFCVEFQAGGEGRDFTQAEAEAFLWAEKLAVWKAVCGSGEGAHLRLQEADMAHGLCVLAPWSTSTWPAALVFSWVMGHHDSFNFRNPIYSQGNCKVRGKQQAVLIPSQCTVTTVAGIYRQREAENSSRHFVPYLEHAQAPPPFSQPIKTVCPAEPTVYMGIFIFPEYTHSTAIYKHRLATAGAGPRVPSASRGDIQFVCKVPCLHMASLSTGRGSGDRTAAPPPGQGQD